MRNVLILIATTALLPAALPAAAQVPMQTVIPDGTILDVTAVGRVVRTPDVATVRAGVVTQATTAAAALSANAKAMARVTAALKAAGIAERDVTTTSVALQPQYRYADNQPPAITGYQASNTVSVKFRAIARAGTVLDALVQAGANQIDGPTMAIDQPEVALDAARTDAVARARARAELYARAAGLRVERIVSIGESGENDGGGPRPPVFYAARTVAAQADTTISPGETDVTATIVVRFLLK